MQRKLHQNCFQQPRIEQSFSFHWCAPWYNKHKNANFGLSNLWAVAKYKQLWKTRMLGSIVSNLASPTACVLIHLFAILIYHSPITNKFLGVLINVLLKFIFTDSLSTLLSQIRYNLFSSTVLSWQGVGGWSFQHRGGSCHGQTDHQMTSQSDL